MHGERSTHLYKILVLQEIKEPELWVRRDKTLALAQAEMGTTTEQQHRPLWYQYVVSRGSRG